MRITLLPLIAIAISLPTIWAQFPALNSPNYLPSRGNFQQFPTQGSPSFGPPASTQSAYSGLDQITRRLQALQQSQNSNPAFRAQPLAPVASQFPSAPRPAFSSSQFPTPPPLQAAPLPSANRFPNLQNPFPTTPVSPNNFPRLQAPGQAPYQPYQPPVPTPGFPQGNYARVNPSQGVINIPTAQRSPLNLNFPSVPRPQPQYSAPIAPQFQPSSPPSYSPPAALSRPAIPPAGTSFSINTAPPAPTYSAPQSIPQFPRPPAYSAPPAAPAYNPPPSSYRPPTPSYSPPPQAYNPPPASYSPPPPAYNPPPPAYNPPPAAPATYSAPPAQYQPPARPAGPQQQAPVHFVNIGEQLQGDYKFGYNTGDGGSFREETRLPDGTVQGQYGFIDADGKQRIVKYTAGKDGFRAEGDDIPKGTPVTSLPVQVQPPIQSSYRPAPSSYVSAPQPSPSSYVSAPRASFTETPQPLYSNPEPKTEPYSAATIRALNDINLDEGTAFKSFMQG